MSLLAWVAVLVAAWCAASVLAATVFATYLRWRRGPQPETADAAGTGSAAPLDPLDTGPMRMWLAELPETPEPVRVQPHTI